MRLSYHFEFILQSLTVLFVVISAQAPPQPENVNINGTNFLDHETPISQFWGQTFLKENIPFIDIPDQNIQDVYYYRWSSLQRHLRYTVAGTGYILTEFCQPVGYASALNTINAAAGHQIDETRWLRSKFYNDDYIQVYTRGPGNTIQYTHWILDALHRRSQVDGDKQFAIDQLADMARLWDEWDYTFDKDAGLYYFTPNFDAQEYSLPGYVLDDHMGNQTVQRDEPNTYRPSHNSYMTANARAIAAVAAFANDSVVESNFSSIASALETAMIRHLWDPNQQFFVDVIQPNNPSLAPISGREEVGFYPYRFGVGLNSTYIGALLELFDTQGFEAPYGPTTLEIRNQYYTATKPSDYCCYWQGQSWPFSTAHTLKSLAAVHRTNSSLISADQYVQYLSTYAATQQKDGVPYVAESHYPFNNSWSADSSNHSEHYDHSTNNDDVITGLLGIIPQSEDTLVVSPIIPSNWTYFALENFAYHGHLITILYDAEGTRYKCGGSFCVFSDGQQIVTKNSTYPFSETVTLNTTPITSNIPINIAANPNGIGYYPLANATYTYVTDDPYKAIDGYLFYDSIPDNRWTNYQSPNLNDTLQVTFARPRTISSVTLALFSDVARGGGVNVPSAIEIYGSNGLLASINGSGLLANDRNTFSFAETNTTFVAVNLFNGPGTAVGVCEFEVWTPPVSGPMFYAVDALLTNALVIDDPISKATSSGAVVATSNSGSVVAFSGIEATEGRATLALSFSNSGSATSVQVSVNQVPQGNLTLGGTGGSYTTSKLSLNLETGKNFVLLSGGSDQLRFETIEFAT